MAAHPGKGVTANDQVSSAEQVSSADASLNTVAGQGEVDTDALRLFDQWCDEFEARWQAGGAPRIEDYLAKCPAGTQGALFAELLALELEYRRDQDDAPKGNEYRQRFPQFKETVASAFATHESLDTTAPDKSRRRRAYALPDDYEPMPAAGAWGAYELMEELGRGGMGVVYRARQTSLNRIVALKMIVSGQFASGDQVRRFYAEAEAAAHLDHPGIVPVYEVGQHQGRHFFAMGFVEGATLSARLAGGPLNPREAAELMHKTALAMAYAHAQGVIHRDLKPSNILVDAANQPRVTDFGLAKRVQGDSALTATGDVLGTPSFMPPEQAAGRAGDVGPAADIYALGATLYALLTGRPPFQAADVAQTLRQVIEQDPVAPRLLNADVDRDLETICLKCLRKEPAARYVSAGDLAADLANYLEGKPIVARPLSRLARLGRLCRRNPWVSTLAGALLLALLAGTATSTFFAIRATRESRRANAALADTEQSIYEYIQTVKNAGVLGDARFQPLRKELLQKAAAHYRGYLERHRDDRDVATQTKMAEALFEMGWINSAAGAKQQSVEAYRQSLAIRERLAAQAPQDVEIQLDLARSWHNLGHVHREMSQSPDALAAFEAALAIRQRLAKEHPAEADYRQQIALSLIGRAATWQDVGRSAEGLQGYTEALALQRALAAAHPEDDSFQSELARSEFNLGHLHLERGETSRALSFYERALAVQERLAQTHPGVAAYLADLAATHLEIGRASRDTGRQAEALGAFEKSLAIRRRLAQQNPTVAEYHRDLAESHQLVGNMHNAAGKVEEALAQWQQALAIREALVRDHPEVTDYQTELGADYNNIGLAYRSLSRPADALETFRKGLAVRERLAKANPQIRKFQSDLARCHHYLGIIYHDTNESDQAFAEWRQALAIREKLARDNPSNATYLCELADSHHNLGAAFQDQKRPDEALDSYQKALAIREKLADGDPALVEFQKELGLCRSNLGFLYRVLEKPAEALESYRQALAVQERLVAAHPTTIEYQVALANSRYAVAQLTLADAPDEAGQHLDKAIQSLGELLAATPHPAARVTLRRSLLERAQLHDRMNRYREAAQDWEQAGTLAEGRLKEACTQQRGLSLARAGDHAAATAAVANLVSEGFDRIEIARLYAIASASAANDEALPAEERTRLAEEYAATGIGHLKSAAQSGHLQDAAQVETLKTNSEFASLQSRDDFRALLERQGTDVSGP